MVTNTRHQGASARIELDRFPRVPLCHGPTPIEPMPRLSAELGGPRLFIKRDDCTGLAGGGNKTRKLEFLVGEALHQKADMLLTQGAVQSNHVRQTAAAACKHGLKCHALWNGAFQTAARPMSRQAMSFWIGCSARRWSFAPRG